MQSVCLCYNIVCPLYLVSLGVSDNFLQYLFFAIAKFCNPKEYYLLLFPRTLNVDIKCSYYKFITHTVLYECMGNVKARYEYDR